MAVDPFSAAATAAAAVALWVLDRAAGSVVSDYARRFWFAGLERLSGKNRIARRQVAEAAVELAKLKPIVNRVLEDNAELFSRVRLLQLQNAVLHAELDSLRRDPSPLLAEICTLPDCPLQRRPG